MVFFDYDCHYHSHFLISWKFDSFLDDSKPNLILLDKFILKIQLRMSE